MKKTFLLVALIIVVPLVSKAWQIPVNAETAVAGANNELAVKLFEGLTAENPEENIFFSPYSIFSALNLAYLGAGGETAAGFGKLYEIRPLDNFHGTFGNNAELLEESRGENQLLNANALWVDSRIKITPEYSTRAKEFYKTAEKQTGFAKPEEAAKEINSWVAENTQEKISNLVSAQDFDEDTRLVITNAVYFKGLWDKAFEPRATRNAKFRLLSGEEKNIRMMSDERKIKYAEIDGVKIAELPYKDSGLSIIFVLPAVEGAEELATARKKIFGEALAKFTAEGINQEATLSIPKFKFETEIMDISELLQQGGLKKAFSDKAEFPLITKDEDLKIDKVLHKAVVEVNEEGTEAAAATAVIAARVVSIRVDNLKYVLDRPFVFLIRDQKTGYILFAGQITNPAE